MVTSVLAYIQNQSQRAGKLPWWNPVSTYFFSNLSSNLELETQEDPARNLGETFGIIPRPYPGFWISGFHRPGNLYEFREIFWFKGSNCQTMVALPVIINQMDPNRASSRVIHQ
jgi:hypothetical protein